MFCGLEELINNPNKYYLKIFDKILVNQNLHNRV